MASTDYIVKLSGWDRPTRRPSAESRPPNGLVENSATPRWLSVKSTYLGATWRVF
jgi:hypothetical protein